MNDGAKEEATLEFLAWLKRFEPKAYSHVMSQIGQPPDSGIFNYRSGFTGLGQLLPEYMGVGVPNTSVPASTQGAGFDFSSWVSSALETAKSAIPAYFQYKTQSDIMEMNIARAKQGLPPVDPGVVAPQVRVIHDVPASVQQEIRAFKLGGQSILLWGGLAVAGFFLFRMIR